MKKKPNFTCGLLRRAALGLLLLLPAAQRSLAGLPQYTVAKVADVYGLPITEQAVALTSDGLLTFTSSYGMVIHTGSGPGVAIPAPAGFSGVSPGFHSSAADGSFAATAFDGDAPAISTHSTVNIPVRYRPGAGYENLGTLNGSAMTVWGMSETGIVVANAVNSEGDEFYAARYRDGEGWKALGALGPLGYARARAVNDAGTVVGDSTNADNSYVPFVYTDAGGMKQIFGPGGETIYGRAIAINQAGFVTGTADGRSFVLNTGNMELTWITPGGTGLSASDINDAGAIIGATRMGGSILGIPTDAAFYWDPENGLTGFEQLIGDGINDWFVIDATDINNDGWILGTAYNRQDQKNYQVLLRPVPEPGAMALLAVGGFGLLARRRRSSNIPSPTA